MYKLHGYTAAMLSLWSDRLFPDGGDADRGQQLATPALLNGSPRLPRAEALGQAQPHPYDILLQRKESEGFGFVILTSKSKPPPGGQTPPPAGHKHTITLTLRSPLEEPHQHCTNVILNS